MFNEGVDLPDVDTVMMLRPTESRVLWLQQFGRGLRVAEGKDRLRVIDSPVALSGRLRSRSVPDIGSRCKDRNGHGRNTEASSHIPLCRSGPGMPERKPADE
jgi:hypothetical protein